MAKVGRQQRGCAIYTAMTSSAERLRYFHSNSARHADQQKQPERFRLSNIRDLLVAQSLSEVIIGLSWNLAFQGFRGMES